MRPVEFKSMVGAIRISIIAATLTFGAALSPAFGQEGIDCQADIGKLPCAGRYADVLHPGHVAVGDTVRLGD